VSLSPRNRAPASVGVLDPTTSRRIIAGNESQHRVATGPTRETALPWLQPGREIQYGFHAGVLVLLVVLISAPLVYDALFSDTPSDHRAHIEFIQQAAATGVWPPHFLYHALVYGLSGFSASYVRLAWTGLVVLTACVAAKATLAYDILARRCPEHHAAVVASRLGLSVPSLYAWMALGLVITAPIMRPKAHIYLGQISSNIWHNPTTMLVWPLALALFFSAWRWLESGRMRELPLIVALSTLSVLAKPNYFLAFAPVFCWSALRRHRFSARGLLGLAALLPAVSVLFWQLTAFGADEGVRSQYRIAFQPLVEWRAHSRSIPLATLFSLGFPLAYTCLFIRSVARPELLRFAWAVLLCALVWMVCFAEVRLDDGTLLGHFNFSWGAHVSLFILFLVTALDLLSNPEAAAYAGRARSARWRAGAVWLLLLLHVGSGVTWYLRQAFHQSYF
jgi:hypothetical protein